MLKAITIVPDLDDLLVVAESYQKLEVDLQIVQDFLQSLGWLFNREVFTNSGPEGDLSGI